MLINGKKDHIKLDDIITCGRNMDISLPRIKYIISEVKGTVLKWSQIASETGIRKETYEGIQSIIAVTINEVFE